MNHLTSLNGKSLCTGLGWIGLILLLWPLSNRSSPQPWILWTSMASLSIGVLGYAYFQYRGQLPGIKNNGVFTNSLSARGLWGWSVGVLLTAFYITIYFYPEWLGYRSEGASVGMVALFDPLSRLLNGQPASQWFLYGTLYTLAILVFGVKFLVKYRHSRYQMIRTGSVMFFQLGFAFLLPELLTLLHPDTPYFAKDFKNMWPLNYYFFEDWHLKNMLTGGSLGLFTLGMGLAMIFIISPILTYRYGKRWYCSWVCGCGALAETAGDSFRQLSSKKISVWKLERWMIHGVLVFITLTTLAVLWSFLGSPKNPTGISREIFSYSALVFFSLLLAAIWFGKRKELQADARYALVGIGLIIIGILCIQLFSGDRHLLGISSYSLRKWYGFGIGAAFSGVLGVGFYPLLGSRVWCRFGCPMAAILGFQQRILSRFRITTNGGQCISCGNCSAYCEMGIDVRSYAQKGQNIVRSSCVGCGICSEVCPRGVLKLENGPVANRSERPDYPLGNLMDPLDAP
ncbi:MAG: 4Fe-4S binding protein [Flavobacteriaceae bacterium]